MAITFRNRIGGWALIAGNLKPQLTDMPELAAQHADLEKTIADAQALVLEQEDLRGRLQKTIRQRQDLEKHGEDLRLRLGAGLQSKLGFRDEGLRTFGIAPKKKSVRRKKSTSPPEQPATATSTSPTSHTPPAPAPAEPASK
jgi:hypothetical protein